MKKYLGSAMHAYAAIVSPLFVILPLLFAAIILFTAEINEATIFLFCMCCGCAVFWLLFIKREALQLYAWGCFEETCVRIHSPFLPEIVLDYEKCKDVGIGCYTHGVSNSRIGVKIYSIYLSYDCFDEQYRESINLWKPNSRRIKVKFSQDVFDLLVANLPQRQAKMLENSYQKHYLVQKKNSKSRQ